MVHSNSVVLGTGTLQVRSKSPASQFRRGFVASAGVRRCVRCRSKLYSDSYDEEEYGVGKADTGVDKEALDEAYRNIFIVQEECSRQDVAVQGSKEDVQRMVETSMLAAVAGLSYMFASLFKLEGYLSYVLPLPVVLSSVRSGPMYSLHCVSVVFLLLFILMGPVRGVTYMLVYGFLSVALGMTFRLNVPWILSVPLTAVVRLFGQWLYIMVTSWITRENLIELLITNAQTLLDNMSAWIGSSGSASFSGVAITLFSMLVVNAVFYVFMMHVLYTIILSSMGYSVRPLPGVLRRFTQAQTPSAL